MNSKLIATVALCLLFTACGDKTDSDGDEQASMDDVSMSMDDSSMDDSMQDDMMQDDSSAVDMDAADVTDVVQTPTPTPPAPQYGPNDIVYAMTDRDATARLILTPSTLTMRLSEGAVERVQSQVRSRDLKDDLKAAILQSIQQVALTELENKIDEHKQQNSQHQISYPLSEVNAMFIREDRLWIDLDREKPLSFDDIRATNGRPILTNFFASDAASFVAAYDSLR